VPNNESKSPKSDPGGRGVHVPRSSQDELYGAHKKELERKKLIPPVRKVADKKK
jgi:hypothetical protein